MKQYSFLTESINNSNIDLIKKSFIQNVPYLYHCTSKTAFDKYIKTQGLKTLNRDLSKNDLKEGTIFNCIYLSTTLNRWHIGPFQDWNIYHVKESKSKGYYIQIDVKKLDISKFIADIDYYRYHLNLTLTRENIPDISKLKSDAFICAKNTDCISYIGNIPISAFRNVVEYSEEDYKNIDSVWVKKYGMNRTPTKDFQIKHKDMLNDIIKWYPRFKS